MPNQLLIGVDGHILTEFPHGSRIYLLNVLREIGELNTGHRFVIFSNDKSKTSKMLPFLDFEHVEFPWHNKFFRLLYYFPLEIRKRGFDAFISQYITPIRGGATHHIVVIHDVLFEDFPQYFSRFFVLRSKILIRRSAMKSSRIITVTDYSSKRIQKHYNTSAEKMVITGNAISDKFSHEHPQATIEKTLRKNSISPPYIFSVSRLDKRKNLQGLINAFNSIASTVKDHELVIVGENTSRLDAMLSGLQHGNRVKALGAVTDDELPLIYAGADLVAFPTRCEGFGIPVIEAMASGCPLVCSDIPALREVAGDAALFFDPDVPGSMEQALIKGIKDSDLRAELIRKGKSNVSRFSWRNTALTLISAIEETCRSSFITPATK